MTKMKNNFDTPILFITYNKFDTTIKVLNKIKILNPSKLIIASDGPKNSEDSKIISNLRHHIEKDLKNINFTKIYNEENKGCKWAVTNAINESFKEHSKLIILEDDTLPSNNFFHYCSNLLDLYSDENKVNLISGYNYLIKTNSKNNYFFSKYSNIWGWATWKDEWESRVELNEKNLKLFLEKDMESIFFEEQEKDYYIERFKSVVYKSLDSWAFGLTFSNLYQNKLSIIPKYNLVKNIGLGHSKATHTKNFNKIFISTPNIRLGLFQKNNYLPDKPKVEFKTDYLYYKKVIAKNSFYNKLVYKFLKVIKKI